MEGKYDLFRGTTCRCLRLLAIGTPLAPPSVNPSPILRGVQRFRSFCLSPRLSLPACGGASAGTAFAATIRRRYNTIVTPNCLGMGCDGSIVNCVGTEAGLRLGALIPEDGGRELAAEWSPEFPRHRFHKRVIDSVA